MAPSPAPIRLKPPDVNVAVPVAETSLPVALFDVFPATTVFLIFAGLVPKWTTPPPLAVEKLPEIVVLETVSVPEL